MRLIRGLNHLDPLRNGCVLTIGNFDGLHLGHRLVIEKLAEHGRRLQLPTVAMVFEPQPLEYFLADHAPSRLTRLREKAIQFAKLPIDELLVMPFKRSLADCDAEQFIADILVRRLNVKHLVVGDDFHFGKARRGNFALLQHRGETYGFSVEDSHSFELAGLRVSSTLIRDALGEGDLAQAKLMLGRDYSVCGRVAHGDKRGRELGFPTANVRMQRKNTPIVGVYAVTMTGLDGKEYQGVANVGSRPTVDGGAKVVLETHLFNFNKDIYGHYVEVHFKHKLRDEIRFDSLDALKRQIGLDVAQAQRFFG
ncbi:MULTISPECIES: bifunctional riboflavin kinase/FAD synthetase [Methylomonas]|uniref:Riboflavin biosynthesis protein n=1 Tax=Methylomonas koyamae TaxID=702114 RepID=A0A177N875_9GAMM|nr:MULTISPECIES: bifunctional riboflavin kinase/FAD synthetase [Methylomonas]ANE57170.1 bifunctional riboflavin kinase/FMN adenylyltransferase [Methylomonas sp. DH-1]ATG92144.1 FMN adenylyltransferase [Methylomonas koyamae]OAI14117.1 bifunctional riboflavin kinase/FMN adenylyltransferase [Methylomonas koyamae]OAI22950.1 bifunctional riboflavin kinase/FMN adenylyltransferase [Methylomonas koyamae]BBL60382.1 riboflavin biosynthesis protein [Methylomonas koyamae]